MTRSVRLAAALGAAGLAAAVGGALAGSASPGGAPPPDHDEGGAGSDGESGAGGARQGTVVVGSSGGAFPAYRVGVAFSRAANPACPTTAAGACTLFACADLVAASLAASAGDVTVMPA